MSEQSNDSTHLQAVTDTNDLMNFTRRLHVDYLYMCRCTC